MSPTLADVSLVQAQALFNANPDAFTDEAERSDLRLKIIRFANDQVYADYIAFNQELFDKMIKYGAYNVRESFRINADTVVDFKKTPNDWD